MQNYGGAADSERDTPEAQKHADPFRAAPSPFAASTEYLAHAYEGPPGAPVHRLTVTSFVIGLIAVVLSLVVGAYALFEAPRALESLAQLSSIPGAVLAIAGIILGHVSYVSADRAHLRGRGFAAAGFILGYLGLVISFLALLVPDSSPVPGIV